MLRYSPGGPPSSFISRGRIGPRLFRRIEEAPSKSPIVRRSSKLIVGDNSAVRNDFSQFVLIGFGRFAFLDPKQRMQIGHLLSDKNREGTMRFQLRRLCVIAAVLATAMSGAQAAEKIRVAVASIAANFAPIYVAQELGYYKESDLEVEATVYRGGGPAQEALAAGAADIVTLSPMTVAVAVQKGIKEKLVAIADPAGAAGFHFCVTKASGIKSMSDLNGKKVGTTGSGSSTDFLALAAAKKAGVKIQTIPLGGNGLLPALKNGQVDAAVLFPPLSYRALADENLISIFNLGKDMDPVLINGIVATDEMIAKRPDVLKRFLKALLKAVVHMQKNEAYSKAFLAKYMQEKDENIINRSHQDIVMGTPPDGVVKAEWVAASIQLLSLVGMKTPPVSEVFTERFIPVN